MLKLDYFTNKLFIEILHLPEKRFILKGQVTVGYLADWGFNGDWLAMKAHWYAVT